MGWLIASLALACFVGGTVYGIVTDFLERRDRDVIYLDDLDEWDDTEEPDSTVEYLAWLEDTWAR